MSSEDILNQRWEKTDKTLKEYVKKFDELGEEIIDEIIELINSLNITYQDINKSISKSDKRKLERKIEEWSKKGWLSDYFGFLVSSRKKLTYGQLLEILIYSIYLKAEEKTKEHSKEIFMIVSEEIYSQAIVEIPEEHRKKKEFSLTWEYIWSLLWIPTYNKSFDDYLKLLVMTAEQEIYKEVMVLLQQRRNIDEKALKPLIMKQKNRLISVNDNKYSGVISDTCRSLGNKMYLEPADDNKDLQVRFIAELDEKTTKMCSGMDGMLFYVNDWNDFYRYSEVDKKDVHYRIKGLEVGVNLPPITNHFHWCRSTITYLIDIPLEQLRKQIKK